MAKQLNINLAFTADSNKAKMQIKELQTQLNSLMIGSTNKDFPLTKGLLEAQRAAAQLKVSLDGAINTNTGKLDLSRFSESLRQSGMSLEQYKNQLTKLGPEGTRTFLSLAQSVMSAEVPIRRTNVMLNEMGTTLKNTARWQISSSILHGFMGSVSSAYGYAKDLNESLNNIRIVTGQNTTQMAQFATQANKAAQALNTTTTKFTDAALIYYQQGLAEESVKERTDITVKMANVTKEKAEDVSSYMTAIWNNFDNGATSLTHFADVITALGAATASSSEEIAAGLEKFAAISDTIGLSYEYAASALATVTAQTRQSADIVGTAYKTIFARIQGLNLGDTLEDGTTLNKYSAALAKVGVDIKNSSSEVKDMDLILNEMGKKWVTLGKDTQIALAQTVAGTRQYNQLIALMDNWSMFQDNLQVSLSSTGELDRQAAIYAESWEAARKRVKAAGEDIFNDLLKDDFFILVLGGFENFLGLINTTTESLGGLRGVLAGISAILLKTFNSQITKGISNLAYNVQMSTESGRKNVQSEKNVAYGLASNINFDSVTAQGEAEADVLQKQISLQHSLIQNSKKMSEEELKRFQQLLDINKAYGDQSIAAAKALDVAEQSQVNVNRSLRSKVYHNTGNTQEYEAQRAAMLEITAAGASAQKSINELNNSMRNKHAATLSTQLEALANQLTEVGATNAANTITQVLTAADGDRGRLASGIMELSENEGIMEESLLDGADALLYNNEATKITTTEADNAAAAAYRLAQAQEEAARASRTLERHTKSLSEYVKNFKSDTTNLANQLVRTAQGISSITMGLSSLGSISETAMNPDISGWDKFISITMSLSMGLPMLISGMSALNKTQLTSLAIGLKKVAIGSVEILTETLKASAIGKTTIAQLGLNAAMSNSPVGIFLAIATVLVGTVGALAVTVMKLSDAYEADAIAAEKANKEAQLTADIYNEISQSYKSLLDTITNYGSAEEAILKLVSGTTEWKDAIVEANKQAMLLIQNYSELSGKYSFNAGSGKIEFNEQALKDLESSQQNILDNTYRNSLVADANARQATNTSDKTNFLRGDNPSIMQGALGGGAKGATVSLLASAIVSSMTLGLGSVLTPGILSIGTTLGAALGSLEAGVTNSIQERKESDIISELQALYSQEGDIIFSNLEETLKTKLNINDEALVTSLSANEVALKELIVSTEANTDAILLSRQQVIGDMFAENITYKTSSNKDALNRILASSLTETTSGLFESKYKDKGALSGGMSDSEVQTQYSRAMGWDSGLVKNKGGNQAVYIDSKNNPQTISDETARRYLAEQEALKGLEATIVATDKALSTLASRTDISSQLMLNMAKGTGAGGLTLGSATGIPQIEYRNSKDLQKSLNIDEATFESIWKSNGFISANAFTDSFNQQMLDFKGQFESLKLPEDLLGLNDLTLSSGQKLRESLNKVDLGSVGKDGGLLYANGLNEMLKTVSPEHQGSALNALTNIDFSDWNAMGSINIILETFGSRIDTGSEKWQIFTDQMRRASSATPDFSTLKADLSVISGIIVDLDFGDTVGAEDYKILKNYNDQLSQYFMITADGSYKALLSKEELHNMTLKQLKDEISVQNQRIKLNDQLTAINWSADGSSVNWDQVADRDAKNADLSTLKEALQNSKETMEILDELGWNAEEVKNASTSQLQSIAKDLDNLGSASVQARELQMMLASTAKDLEQLDAMFREGAIGVYEYTKAYSLLDVESTLDGLDPDEVKKYASYLEDTNEALSGNSEMATKTAASIMRMNRGVGSLLDGFEEWKSILEESTEGTEEFYTALDNMKEALSDITNVSGDYISKDFISTHMDEIAEAAKGDEVAIDSLRSALSHDIVAKIILDNEIDDEGVSKVKSAWAEIQDLIPTDLDIGISISDFGEGSFVDTLNRMALTANMSAAQINEVLSSIGFEAKFASQPQKIPNTVNETTTVHQYKPRPSTTAEDGSTISNWETVETSSTVSKPVDGTMTAFSMTTDGTTPKIASVSQMPKGSSNDMSSSNRGQKPSGGGGSKAPKKEKLTKKSDVVDRYYEITDSIEDMSDALEDANRLADRLYGRDRLAAMEKESKILRQQADLLEEKKKQAQQYLKEDKQSLLNNKYGIDFTLDADGDISNYTDTMEFLYKELNAAEVKHNTLSTSDAQASYKEQTVQPIQDKIDELKELISQYDDSQDLLIEIDNEIQDKLNEWQDKNYEIITHKVDIQIELSEAGMQELEYYLNKMSDDFYRMAESAALMNKEVPYAIANLDAYQTQFKELSQAMANGTISQSQYIEGLRASRSSIFDNLSALNELDKSMMHYYEDTLDSAAEELSKYTSQMEHSTTILEHFEKMLGLIGKEQDYLTMGTILDGQLETTQDQLAVQKRSYNTLIAQKKTLASQLASASLGKAERELIEAEYDAIVKSVQEAEKEIYSTTAALGEIAMSILQNNLAQARKELEAALTGGGSIDDMLENIDRLSIKQEEYLTNTNKLYETNKLIRQAQSDMDKTDSVIAKQKYKDYVQYMEKLSEQGKLSEYELSIAQAKYDLLQAEIALEEAQNMKDQVRLSRDSEGNWGYTYTANENKIADAEQAYADAQNKLYNIGLDGAQEYQSKYAETLKKATEAFAKIQEDHQNGVITSEEEYNSKMLEAKTYYTGLLSTYNDLYYKAHDLLVDESYTNEADYILAGIGNLEDFKNATDEYLNNCNSSFDDWKNNTQEVIDLVGEDLEDTADRVDDITDASNNLKNEVIRNIIPALENELKSVKMVTDEWAAQRDILKDVIAQYERLAKVVGKEIGIDNNIGYDSQKDYSSVMQQYLASGKKDASWIKQMQEEREAKIAGEGLSGEIYGSRGNQFLLDLIKGSTLSSKDMNKLLRDLGVQGYASGGYTGEWGSEAKLAALHEKEIVLNSSDTANLLSAVSIIRSISDLLDQRAMMAALGLMNISTAGIIPTESEVLEQNVLIQAEFPSVTEHNEIELALTNLVNNASQYANKK